MELISIVDHGIDHAQYFQGDSAIFSAFENSETGCGENFKEAVDDALESIALELSDSEFSAIEYAVYSDPDYLGANQNETAEGDEMYYYVSIRYNIPKFEQTEEK